jgi:hypothetical protein
MGHDIAAVSEDGSELIRVPNDDIALRGLNSLCVFFLFFLGAVELSKWATPLC